VLSICHSVNDKSFQQTYKLCIVIWIAVLFICHSVKDKVSNTLTYSQRGLEEAGTALWAPPVVSQLFWAQAQVRAVREPGPSWSRQCPVTPASVTHIAISMAIPTNTDTDCSLRGQLWSAKPSFGRKWSWLISQYHPGYFLQRPRTIRYWFGCD
jgi:hypothetical protein